MEEEPSMISCNSCIHPFLL
jgi:hypothetical protein